MSDGRLFDYTKGTITPVAQIGSPFHISGNIFYTQTANHLIKSQFGRKLPQSINELFAMQKYHAISGSNLSQEVGNIKDLVSSEIQQILSHEIFGLVKN